MNPGMITSFVIAGLLILAIGRMNLRLGNHSTEVTLSHLNREYLTQVTELLHEDFPNMGYDVKQPTDPVLVHGDSSKISFYRNVYRDSTRTPQLVTWELLDQPIPGRTNPDHRSLLRIEADSALGTADTTWIRSGITQFELSYFSDTQGKPMSDRMNPAPGSNLSELDRVRQVHVEMELQSREPIQTGDTGATRYLRSVYDRRFTPRNLN
ncbi:MAG: hypothetical protein WEA36_09435 [Balneolaceae bacterium]